MITNATSRFGTNRPLAHGAQCGVRFDSREVGDGSSAKPYS
jgi:hypothetical protein